MKSALDIYNATFNNEAWRSLKEPIESLPPQLEEGKARVVNLIIDLAIIHSEPYYVYAPMLRRPMVGSKLTEIAAFALEHDLGNDFLNRCQRYFNRFFVMALLETLQIQLHPHVEAWRRYRFDGSAIGRVTFTPVSSRIGEDPHHFEAQVAYDGNGISGLDLTFTVKSVAGEPDLSEAAERIKMELVYITKIALDLLAPVRL